jgi:hypothetical protein
MHCGTRRTPDDDPEPDPSRYNDQVGVQPRVARER